MIPRRLAFFLLLLALSIFSPVTAAAGVPSSASRPNLLLITIDTLRADRLGGYGSADVKTAVMDSLAARGGLFLRAFAQATTTLPSHANILLGLTPLVHGVHDNSNFVVPRGLLTLAEHLKASGYATAAVVGAYPLDRRFGLERGFDLYDDDYGFQNFESLDFVERRAEAVVRRAGEWLKGQKGSWFLWVHCFDPHAPYDPPEPYRTRYAGRLYDGEVAYTDSALEPLVDELKASGGLEKTMIILTADHGESLGEHGESTHGYLAYNATLRVPLIICVPGLKPVRVQETVAHQDIFPTVCDALGLSIPKSLPGSSLIPVLRGKRLSRRPLYFESLYPYYSRGWAPLRGVISGNMKFIDSPIPELYDFAADFGEAHNLENPAALVEWRRSLDGLIRSRPAKAADASAPAVDARALEKLRSLGYVTGRQTAFKSTFGPEDDIKTLLPFNNRAEAAFALYKAGKVKEAVAELEGILAEREDFDLSYTFLGLIYRKQGDRERALRILRQGLERLPADYEVFVAYVSALLEAGRYDRLIETIRSREDPRQALDPEVWNALGVAYSSTGKLDEAVEAFGKALSVDPDFPKALSNLGTVYLIFYSRTREERSLETSLEQFRRAVGLDPGSAAAWNGLGAAYRQAGNLDQAISAWEKSLESDPGFGNALYNLGTAYLDKGEKTKALASLEKYRALHSASLSDEDKAKLEDLIRQCR